jgi:hypothetical protein
VLAGESFTAELWGGAFHGVPIEFLINGQGARAAAEIGAENTRLRAKLATLEAAAPPAEVEAALRAWWDHWPHVEADLLATVTALVDAAAKQARMDLLHEANDLLCGGLSSSLNLEHMRDMYARVVVAEAVARERERCAQIAYDAFGRVAQASAHAPGWLAGRRRCHSR